MSPAREREKKKKKWGKKKGGSRCQLIIKVGSGQKDARTPSAIGLSQEGFPHRWEGHA